MLYRILFLLLLHSAVYSQNTIGIPDVVNYYKGTYSAGLQNWDLKQDKNGIIYVANNEGLLSFDGKYWKLYPLPNKTNVRSVEIGPDNKVYVGGQDELGYFSPAANGKLQYTSITNLLPEKVRSFGDAWDIVCFGNDIFIRTLNNIFKLSNKKATVYNANSVWSYMAVFNNHVYAQDLEKGLFTFENGVWNPIQGSAELVSKQDITGMLPMNNDSIIITTLKKGLFLLHENLVSKINSQNNPLFEKERIYCATKINNNWIVLASTYSGIYITDTKGNIIQRFSKREGLQNNNVLSVFLDKESNLWLGLDNGIDFIAYNSAIKQINPSLQDGPGYAAIINKDQLLMGTSNGLYSVPLQKIQDLSFSKGDFTPVTNTKGQVWGLAEINNQLLLGHHDGAFIITNNTATPISKDPGYWNFVTLTTSNTPSKIVAGNYNGLGFFDFINGQYIQSGKIPGFIESSRFVATDNKNNYWVSHPYHGVYRIYKKTDSSFTSVLYTDNKGLPSVLNNQLFKIKNEVVFATEKGIYFYNSSKDFFEPSPYYQKILGTQSIRYMKEDKSGNIWFIHEKVLGVIDLSGKEPTVIYIPELNNKMLSGFESIYSVNDNNIFLGGEKGFFHINYEKYKNTVIDLNVQIRVVKITDKTDSLLFGGFFKDVNDNQIQDSKNIPQISHTWKTIHFEFSSAVFGFQSNLEYSYRLKGYDENWSEWTKRTEKEYTNLAEGKYTFEVKTRNNLGKESEPAFFIVRILPPWYKTIWALFIYLLIFLALLYTLYKWLKKKFRLQQTRYEEEQKRLLYIHELERNKTETEMVALGNEKLEAEINFKNSELASSAMHLVKKGELISKIKGEIVHVIKGLDNPLVTAELKKMIKAVSEDDNMDKEWENFTKHFDKVQSDFLVELKEKHPSITGNELKLCAYLRMNLSTKEIAQLMNISVRGVEISRYRLRKKLQVATETSLFDYLIKIQTKP